MKARNKFHFIRTLELAWPAVISQASHMLVNLTDTLIVGRLGEVELAAAALCNSIVSIILVFSIGFSFPITALVAQSVGEKDEDKTRKLFWHGLVLCTAIGIAIVALALALLPLADLLGQPSSIMVYVPGFTSQLALSIIPLMIYQGFKQFIEGLGDTRPAMVVGLIVVGLNAGLNFLFIYGWGPVPAMGVIGSGWATHSSRWFLAILIGAYVLMQKDYRIYIHKAWQQAIDWLLVKETLGLGLPISLQLIFEVACFASAAIMMGWITPEALAAHQSVLTLAGTTYMAASGIGTATTIRTGNFYGERNPDQMWRAAKAGILSALILMATMGVLMAALNGHLPYLFLKTASTAAVASDLLLFAALFQMADGAQVVILGALRGMNDVRIPTLITLIAYWGIALPLGYFLAFELKWQGNGIWAGLTAGLFVAAIVLFIRLKNRIRYFAEDPARIDAESASIMAH